MFIHASHQAHSLNVITLIINQIQPHAKMTLLGYTRSPSCCALRMITLARRGKTVKLSLWLSEVYLYFVLEYRLERIYQNYFESECTVDTAGPAMALIHRRVRFCGRAFVVVV